MNMPFTMRVSLLASPPYSCSTFGFTSTSSRETLLHSIVQERLTGADPTWQGARRRSIFSAGACKHEPYAHRMHLLRNDECVSTPRSR
jgi:hypothetical protein